MKRKISLSLKLLILFIIEIKGENNHSQVADESLLLLNTTIKDTDDQRLTKQAFLLKRPVLFVIRVNNCQHRDVSSTINPNIPTMATTNIISSGKVNVNDQSFYEEDEKEDDENKEDEREEEDKKNVTDTQSTQITENKFKLNKRKIIVSQIRDLSKLRINANRQSYKLRYIKPHKNATQIISKHLTVANVNKDDYKAIPRQSNNNATLSDILSANTMKINSRPNRRLAYKNFHQERAHNPKKKNSSSTTKSSRNISTDYNTSTIKSEKSLP